MPRNKTTEEFIKEAIEIHGNRYDYSKVNYVNSKTKVTIICPTHGEFEQVANSHLRNSGCSKCAYENMHSKKTTEEFIKEAIKIHGNLYDYSKVNYVNSKTKVIIICSTHGEFKQTANNHLSGYGCKSCAKIITANKNKYSTEEFIKRARSLHGNKYDYSKTIYTNSEAKVIIICPSHGEFIQSASSHLQNRGCAKCGINRASNIKTSSLDYFIKKAHIKHKNKYDYSKVNYVHNQEKIIITCPLHGDFLQRPYSHLNGHGCSLCTKGKSQPENDIINYIKSLGFEVNQGDRSILGGRELDIVIPSKKVAIEYNGLEFHREGLVSDWNSGKSKMYHLQKTIDAKNAGFDLIQVFSDEWLDNKDLIKLKIAHILGVSKAKKIYARKCIVTPIKLSEAKELLNNNHVQGSDNSGIRYGAYFEEKLVAVMTFLRNGKKGYFKLNRFATNTSYRVIGIASKLLKSFEREYNPKEIITYSDRRWTTNSNNVYTAIGFEHVGATKPGYFYYIPNGACERLSRQKFMKHKLLKLYPKYDKSWKEREIMVDLGYDRIWDCGHFKYLKKY